MFSITRMPALLLFAAALSLYAQESPDATRMARPDPPAVPSSATTAPAPNRAYTFPDGKQQFRNYLYYTFGPPGWISTAIGAGIDQSKPAPPEWDSGAQGYAERYGWRFSMNLTTKAAEYSLGALMHEDVAYHPCACSGLLPRASHAFLSVLTAKTPGGRTVFSLPPWWLPTRGLSPP